MRVPPCRYPLIIPHHWYSSTALPYTALLAGGRDRQDPPSDNPHNISQHTHPLITHTTSHNTPSDDPPTLSQPTHLLTTHQHPLTTHPSSNKAPTHTLSPASWRKKLTRSTVTGTSPSSSTRRRRVTLRSSTGGPPACLTNIYPLPLTHTLCTVKYR